MIGTRFRIVIVAFLAGSVLVTAQQAKPTPSKAAPPPPPVTKWTALELFSLLDSEPPLHTLPYPAETFATNVAALGFMNTADDTWQKRDETGLVTVNRPGVKMLPGLLPSCNFE